MQQRFQSDAQDLSNIKVSKIVLSSNNDKNIQTFNCVETYEYGTSKKILEKDKNIKQNKVLKKTAK